MHVLRVGTIARLGPKLVQIGVPVVVAMQENVTVLTARQFAATFYQRLLVHGLVDRAMNEARDAAQYRAHGT